jgi:hypothetical protein
MPGTGLLVLPLDGATTGELLRSQPPADYTDDERRLSAHVEHAVDRMILGRCDDLVLLKLYPIASHTPVGVDGEAGTGADGTHVALHGLYPDGVRPETAARLAAETLNFFGPLHGGILVQEYHDDILVQGRRYTCAYPHITLERYDAYDAPTSDPLLISWRARRIQNLRRETRTNRTIDVALLSLEIAKSLFSVFLT